MTDTDRFLAAIVLAALALVAVAGVLVVRQPEKSYRQPEDTPEAVVHNYLLALRRKDYQRAYGYLSPQLDGYPDSVEQFVDDVTRDRWAFRVGESAAVEVESTEITGRRAVVWLRETTFESGGLFDSYQRTRKIQLKLEQVDGEWRLVGGDGYWSGCWTARRSWCLAPAGPAEVAT